jgi:outer membrane protein TolC
MQRSVSAVSARSVILGTALALLCGAATGTEPVPELPKIPIAPLSAPTPLPKEQDEKGQKNGDKNGKNGDAKSVEVGPELTLGECIAIAQERSPGLRALRNTYEATAASSQALNNIGSLGELFAPDLPVRKQQAACGLRAAAADIQKKQNELTQATTRLYFTVVYARQQQEITEDVVAQIELLMTIARELLKAGDKRITQGKIDTMGLGLDAAMILRLKARSGAQQAMEGLRQLMNVKEEDFPFRVADKELPVIGVKPGLTKEIVRERALAARPEIVLAAAGLDAFRLEVYAQARVRCGSTVRTFASGSDIHARPTPPGSMGAEYRPEPLAPEMPPYLVGSQTDRVNRAMAYCRRAEAMYEDTRTLIALEAGIAFIKFDEATKKLEIAKDQLKNGKSLMERTREGFENPNAEKDMLVGAYVAASKAHADYVDAVFEHVLALAALERITGGTIRAPFANR